MFNQKHPLSVRLHRWMTLVLALGIFSFAPVAPETILPSANSAGSAITFPWAYSTSTKATVGAGWVTAANIAGQDDTSVEVLGDAFTTFFNGTAYTKLWVSTNLYMSFANPGGTIGAGTTYPAVLIGNGDARAFQVYYKRDSSVLHIRWEGYAYYSSYSAGTPDTIFEARFYANQNYFDIGVGIHGAPTRGSGLTAPNSWLDYFVSSASDNVANKSVRFTTAGVFKKVTFNANSGSGSPSVPDVTQTSSGASVSLANVGTMTRTGYTFTGWNTAADGSGTNYTGGTTYTPAADITLYAQWNSTITYNANRATSGSIPTATTAKSSGSVTTLASNSGTLARTNYVFGGWNTNETGTGTSYAAGLTTYASPGNTTLYARWNSTVTYNANGATSGSVPTASTLSGSAGTLAMNTGTLAKTNYAFAGWNTNEQGTGTFYAAGTTSYPPAGAATLYAQWNSTITYNANSQTSGSVPATTSIPPAGGTLAQNTGTLAKSGATFVGWGTLSDGLGTFYAPGAIYPNTGNITLFAQYSVALALSGSTTLNTNLGSAATSLIYTASNGIGNKTFTHVVTPSTAGITIDTATTNSLYIKVGSTVSAGIYTDTITATDAAGSTVVKVVTITVASPMRFDSNNGTSVTTSVGRAAELQLSTIGGSTGKTYTLTHISSPSSAGITLDTTTAASGIVTVKVATTVAAGSYTESITATDASGLVISTRITVNVNPAPVLMYESATAGSNFSSLSLNGTNQYVTVPANANLVMGSDYTIEWWQYQTDNNAYTRIFSFGGNGLEVSLEGGTFYYWLGGGRAMNTAGTLNVKNKWAHFAIVSRNNSVTVYQDGIALSAAQTLSAVTTSNLPSSAQLCIGSECNTTTWSMFGGQIANFTISKTPRYAGTSLSSANFTPSKFSTVDANTLLALGAVNSESKFTDSSSYLRTVSYVGTPTGNSNHPAGASTAAITLVTTQGITKRSSGFVASSGTGIKTFTMTPTVGGITLDTSLANNAYVVVSDTVTATNSTTARVINESVTATDSLGSSTSFNVAITVNPPIALTATATSFSSTAGLVGYDTITATAGTGTGAITYSLIGNPVSSGITLVSGAARVTVLTIAKSVSSGTYYETVTATDSLGATTSIPITVTVNPGISLTGENGITTVTTSAGRAATLQVNAINGGSGKTFTKQAASVATSAGITLNTSNAASGFAIIQVANTVPANTYLETITVTDSQGGAAKLLVTIVVNPAPTLTGPSTIVTTAGKAASTTVFAASSGTGIKTLTLSGLNSGITIDTSTANSATVNLGTSLTSINTTTLRTITETVTATDAAGATVTRTLTVTVNPSVIETATATSITTTSGVARTVTIHASQGTGNKTFTRTSAVASSAILMTTLVANQAVLTIGTLTSAGTYYETITATDTLNAATSIVITIVINGPPTVSGSSNLYTTQGVTFNSPLFQAFGGDGTYTFTLQSNPTAVGISASSPVPGYARISVLNTVSAGTYNETLTVTDGLGATGFIAFRIRVNSPVALTGTQAIRTTYGEAFTTGFNSSGGTGPFTFTASNICAVSRSTFIGNGLNGTISGTSYTVDQVLGTGLCDWIRPLGVDSATVLIVGGGGAGGTVSVGSSGGGGGGQVRQEVLSLSSAASVQVSVGAGGTATAVVSVASVSSGGNGGASSVTPAGGSTISALGGGGGANSRIYDATQGFGSITGFTGGGGSVHAGTASLGSTGTGGSPYKGGNANANSQTTDPQAAGGGGGAGGAGTAATSGAAGSGGIGIESIITGSSKFYGGGGGGGKRTTSGTAGTASGGGGAGNKAGAGFPGSTNTGGGGGGAGEAATSAQQLGGTGGSGVVVLRYVTPTVEADNTKISYLVTSAGTSSTAGLITLSIPEGVNAGSYSHTVKATDSTGSVSLPVTIDIIVDKANPVLTLALPGNASSVQYGFGVQLSAQASTAGSFQFRDNGTTISGCGTKSTTSFVATCRWVPSTVATRTISAVFTPTDLTNYNTGVTSTMSVVVTKADTLTVTSASENFIFTNSAAAVTERFTIDGLAEIDSVTVAAASITTTYIGTANDSSTVNSTTAPSKAGNSYEIKPSGLVFATGSASNYANIVYVSGVLSIARAVNNGNFNYSASNQLTYSLGGTDSPTVTTFGEALPSFTGANPEKCSINSTTGLLSILEAGTCAVTMDVPQGYNYLATSIAKSVIINKAPRTFTLSMPGSTIKYGDTATVTSAISVGELDGLITYSSTSPSLCQFDDVAGEVTAKSGSGSCGLTAQIGAGTNYLAATSNTLSITAAKADAPGVIVDEILPVSYANGNSIAINPTITVTGLKFADTAASATYTYVFTSSPAGTFSYSATSAPTEGGTYNVVPSSLVLSSGSLANYQTPVYSSARLDIEQIDQPELLISNLTGELLFPIGLRTTGGASSAPAATFTVTTSTATNCRVVYGPMVGNPSVNEWMLQADSAGSCSIVASRAQTRNFRIAVSETATVSVLEFKLPAPVFVNNFSTGVTLSSTVTLSKGEIACTTGCVPTITSVLPYEGYIGDLIVITGTNFTGATKVIFGVFVEATNFANDPANPDTMITVQVPPGLNPGFIGIEVRSPGGITPRNFDFELLP